MSAATVIARNYEAAALCDRAEGRLANLDPDGNPVAQALILLDDQWQDAKRTWDNPSSTAYQVAIGTVRTIGAAFPTDSPRTILSAAHALLDARARHLEVRS